MAISKRQRKKRAQTNKRLGRLYKPKNRFNRMIQITSVDIDPHNKYYMDMLTTAEHNLFQLNNYFYDRVELEAVDVDTLRWFTSNEFLKIIDKIRDLARVDPAYYKHQDKGYIMLLIADAMKEEFNELNHASGHKIIGTFYKVLRDLKGVFEKYKDAKRQNSNPFVVVYYESNEM